MNKPQCYFCKGENTFDTRLFKPIDINTLTEEQKEKGYAPGISWLNYVFQGKYFKDWESEELAELNNDIVQFMCVGCWIEMSMSNRQHREMPCIYTGEILPIFKV